MFHIELKKYKNYKNQETDGCRREEACDRKKQTKKKEIKITETKKKPQSSPGIHEISPE